MWTLHAFEIVGVKHCETILLKTKTNFQTLQQKAKFTKKHCNFNFVISQNNDSVDDNFDSVSNFNFVISQNNDSVDDNFDSVSIGQRKFSQNSDCDCLRKIYRIDSNKKFQQSCMISYNDKQ
eukprot:TRINITY_DN476_c0_g2_i1.p11 TRINITY_DN476_c0_g2~~TRINITY_DN476_c0_g2_i1.p11  ORF type:complete len:122 (+),score=1.28 TRINITY_DN476_c0_g2_i1:388-753(+)